MSTTSPLFEPFASGTLKLPNRFVMAPMTRSFSPGGVPGSNVAAYYRRRAEGGVGLIITEGTWIPHASASNDDNVPRFHGDDATAGWRRVVAEVHAGGGRIVPQIWHTGLQRATESDAAIGGDGYSGKLGPSGYVAPGEKVAEGAADADLQAIVEAYGAAARTAFELGFDGVEIHAAHGYLMDQFFWHETNHRADLWGGTSLKERVRFGVEVVKACRAATSADFPIILRFSQWKLQDYAARLADTPQELALLLEPLATAGVDVFHASQRRFWEPEFAGSRLNLAGWAKKITGKPVITVGSVGLELELMATMGSDQSAAPSRVDAAEEMVARGDVDLVAVGRALLGDPSWVDKVRRNAFDEFSPYDNSVLANLV